MKKKKKLSKAEIEKLIQELEEAKEREAKIKKLMEWEKNKFLFGK